MELGIHMHGERLAVIEERIKHMADALDEHIAKDDEIQKRIEHKLDELLRLKHRGAGAIWMIVTALTVLTASFAGHIMNSIKGFFNG